MSESLSARQVGKALFAGLSSYALTIVLLLYLMALTFKGTFDQQYMSTYDAQQLYFSQMWFPTRPFSWLTIYLPGANLILTILAVNLICGGLIRIRKKLATAGVIIAHLGILWMLSAGLVEYHFSDRGYLTLYEHEQDDEFVDFNKWEIVVGELLEEGRVREHMIPAEQVSGMDRESKATFRSASLPFDLVVERFLPSSRPMQMPRGVGGVGGFYLRPLAKDPENASNNLAGAYVQIVDKATGKAQPGLLWGGSPEVLPMTFRVGGKDWMLTLRRPRYPLPFGVRLNKFTKLDHPGISMASEFSSNVTKIEDGAEQDVTISMNEPLRRKGYTLFQTNWGPQNVPNPSRLYSQFEVVRNPADQWPLWSCLVILFGLVFHFSMKLIRYIQRCQAEGRMV